jgi:plastocyanin
MRSRAPLTAASLLLAASVAACGTPTRELANPDTATRAPQETVQPTVFPSPTATTEAPTASPTDGNAPAPATSAPPAGSGNTVAATATNKFEPAEISVKAGTKVVWNNQGGFHTVTGGDGQPDPASPMNGTLSNPGQTYEVTFDKPGTYPYFCQPHLSLGMKGTVTVT